MNKLVKTYPSVQGKYGPQQVHWLAAQSHNCDNLLKRRIIEDVSRAFPEALKSDVIHC